MASPERTEMVRTMLRMSLKQLQEVLKYIETMKSNAKGYPVSGVSCASTCLRQKASLCMHSCVKRNVYVIISLMMFLRQ